MQTDAVTNTSHSLLVLSKSVKTPKLETLLSPGSDSAAVRPPASTAPVHSSFHVFASEISK